MTTTMATRSAHMKKVNTQRSAEVAAMIDFLSDLDNGTGGDYDGFDSFGIESSVQLRGQINSYRAGKIAKLLGKNLNKITAEHIRSFQKSYESAVPQFEQLNNLKELPPIKAAIDSKSETLKNEANSNTKQLVESIEKLDVTLKQMKNDFNNSSIPNRLNAIEKQMQNKKPVPFKNGKDIIKKVPSPKPTFLKRVGNLFRSKKNGKLENKKEVQKEKEITKKNGTAI